MADKKKKTATKPTASTPLNKNQLAFCYEYIANKYNATAAAIAAGYSKRAARMVASRLLTYANVKKKVKELTEKYLTDIGLNSEQVIKELGLLAFQDMTDFCNLDSSGVTLKSFEQMGAATKCIKEIEVDKDGKIKIKMHDKKGSLELLGKHLELFTENVKHSGSINMSQDENSDAAYKRRFKKD